MVNGTVVDQNVSGVIGRIDIPVIEPGVGDIMYYIVKNPVTNLAIIYDENIVTIQTFQESVVNQTAVNFTELEIDDGGKKSTVQSTLVTKAVDENYTELEDYEETDSETEYEIDLPNLEIPDQNLADNATTKSEITILANETANGTKGVTSTAHRTACTWMPKRNQTNKAETEQFIDSDKFYTDFLASLVFINKSDTTFHCILVIVSKNCLIARALCLYHLRGSILTDYFILKRLPDDAKKHKLYEVASLSYHPLIWEGGLEVYNYAVVKTDSEIDMRTQRFPVIPMHIDIMSLYVGQKVLLLGYVRLTSATHQQSLVKFQGNLIPESNCSKPPQLKPFLRHTVDISKPRINSIFHCIAFLDKAPKQLWNFTRIAPVFRGLKFMGFVKTWNRLKPMPFVSLIEYVTGYRP